jgi:hypothetical protein
MERRIIQITHQNEQNISAAQDTAVIPLPAPRARCGERATAHRWRKTFPRVKLAALDRVATLVNRNEASCSTALILS